MERSTSGVDLRRLQVDDGLDGNVLVHRRRAEHDLLDERKPHGRQRLFQRGRLHGHEVAELVVSGHWGDHDQHLGNRSSHEPRRR
jgi:hypothetical protein